MPSLVMHETIPGHHYQLTYNLFVQKKKQLRVSYDYAHYAQDGFKYPTFTCFIEVQKSDNMGDCTSSEISDLLAVLWYNPSIKADFQIAVTCC